jgi:hypothetical protein
LYLLGKSWYLPIAVESNEELGFYYIEIGVQMNEIDARAYEIKSA